MFESYHRLLEALLAVARDLVSSDGGEPAGDSATTLTTPFSNISEANWVAAVQLWNAHGRSLIAALEPRPCPACGGERHRDLFESYDGYRYVECEDCGCWYVPLRVEAALFEEFFTRCPEARAVAEKSFEGREADDYQDGSLERIGAYLDLLLPLLHGAGRARVLDVGCGLGHSLVAAAERGLVGFGTESSKDCIRIARERGLEVFDAADPLPAGPFRLITFWESLEHMSEPYEILAECRERLEPEGLVALTVPNVLSPAILLQRADCPVVHGGYDTPGHTNLFGPETLRRLLERSGYALLDLDGQYGASLTDLFAYGAGLHRGAHDLLLGRREARGLSEATIGLMRWTGPAFSLLERIAHLSPILVVIACRKEAADAFRADIERLRNARRERLLAEIDSLVPKPQTPARIREAIERRRDRFFRIFRRREPEP